jgi:hypothetical protein
VHTPWFAKANKYAPHRLDSHTSVQIVLACELVEPRDLQWGVVAHYGPWILHVAIHGIRAFFN